MSKIFKLFINENIKTWKKFSTKLSIILIIISLIGTLSLVKIIQKYEEKGAETNTVNDWKFSAEKEIEYIKEILKDETISDSDRRNFEITLERFEMAIEYDINTYYTYWKNDLLNQITTLKQQGDTTQNIAKFTEILKNNDFEGYINIQREELKKQELSQEEYDDKIMILDLQAKYEIGKDIDEAYWKTSILNETELLKQSVRTGIDYRTNKLLTVEQNQDYKNKIKINMYRLEKDMPSTDYSVENNFRILFEVMASNFVVVVIAITAIIIAGGAIATEVSTGTIKFWTLTPNKRWKIMTAKIMSLLFYIIVVTVIISLLTAMFANIFFDTDGNEYLYIKNGNVEKIGNTLFIIGYYFAKIIPLVVFAIFALMLSTITRNSSVAISLSLAIYMGNGIAMSIINTLLKKDWIKFIPFNNLNLADKIFPNFENTMAIITGDIGPTTSLGFSLFVLGVCTILMLVTSYDSFNNRDII